LEMAGVFEKSFSASVRVDARDLAIVARWMQANGQRVTRSGILGQALKVVAQGIVEQEPTLDVDTLEKAYTELAMLRLAPQSAQGLLSMARALQTEQMAQSGNMEFVVNRLTNMARGQGLEREEVKRNVMAGVDELAQEGRRRGIAEQLGIEEGDVDMLNQAVNAMRQTGMAQEEIENRKSALIATYRKANNEKEVDRLSAEKTAMAEQMAKFKAISEEV